MAATVGFLHTLTATTPKLLQHPSHDHPLVHWEFTNDPIAPLCHLCHRKISADGYTCREECNSYYYHTVCAEAPPLIDPHPSHPPHSLSLVHGRSSFLCNGCHERFRFGGTSFRCDECDFDLDISCALSTIMDRGGSPVGTTPEQITLPCHPHPLTSFSTRDDFVEESDCVLCQAYVERDGYRCLRRRCKFLIHMGCIPDLYYVDGTKTPRVYHCHRLETFVVEDTSSKRCENCGSNKSGEFIGCASCEVFIHRDCIQVTETLQYPHHPDHTLILFLNNPNLHGPQCRSCSGYLECELGYHCTSCNFFLHLQCALQTLAYCKEGMSLKVEVTLHKHPLLLCHRTESVSGCCFLCDDDTTGPVYACKEQNCEFLLHLKCSSFKETRTHPHHPNHELTLCPETDGPCEACRGEISFYSFSCKLCAFYLHLDCANRIPTEKHCLHEHELLCLDKVLSLDCNRCGATTDSPFFRCVSCNFNLHEKCMELPQVLKSEIHWHELTLHETYMEDDSGEYYCDHCEKRRNVRLGVYVCEKCSARWAYHIECVLPELRKVFEKKSQTSVIKRLNERIAKMDEEVHAADVKLEEMKRELDELKKERDELVAGEDKDYESATKQTKQEEDD